MRVRTLEIRWHDSKPINSCDFQPVPPKKSRPANDNDFTQQAYRLATAGEDNNVRVWMVYPNMLPPSVVEGASTSNQPAPHPPRVEYLSTLAKHQAPVNVVRFSPNGELIASAGDDGMVIIWCPSSTAPSAAFGSETEELSYDKEFWKARTPFRCTTMQVYDLAWSPTGEYIITGSTDNTARIFTSADGKCIREIAEHSHYVQGVAWDPLNEYIATQSSDRSVHVYSVAAKQGPSAFEVHAVGKNTKMSVRQSRTPSVTKHHSSSSSSRVRGGATATAAAGGTRRRESASVASDAESGVASDRDDIYPPPPPLSQQQQGQGQGQGHVIATPLTPAPSIASTPSASGPPIFLPPPSDRTLSRRSSFSSVAPGSPAPSHYSASNVGGGDSNFGGGGERSGGGGGGGRTPSPSPSLSSISASLSGSMVPPLPAIRAPPSPQLVATVAAQTRMMMMMGSGSGMGMYGDESFTNFFRRLAFSPDGGLLLTPSGHFEDPSNIGPLMGGGALVGGSGGGSGGGAGGGGEGGEILRGRRGHPSDEYLDDTGSVGGAGTTATTAAGDPSGSGSGGNGSGSGSGGSGGGGGGGGGGSASSVFIYSRANFARPPIGQLPGHKKASIAVKFSPVLYSLRAGVVGAGAGAGEEQSQSQSQSHGHEHGHGHGSSGGSGSGSGGQTVNVAIERGMNEIVDVDMVGLGPGSTSTSTSTSMISESYAEGEPSCSPSKRGSQPPSQSQSQSQSDSWSGAGAAHTLPSPALSAIDGVPRTPGKRDRDRGRRSGGSGSTSGAGTGTVFALPYRMLFAVATMDSISIHDTQQAGPIALLTKLHYDEFTDMTWSPDGQCLILSSRDGYCTIVIFDEPIPAHSTQQHAIQLQSMTFPHPHPHPHSHIQSPSHTHTQSPSHTQTHTQTGTHAYPHTPTHSRTQSTASARTSVAGGGTGTSGTSGTGGGQGHGHGTASPTSLKRSAPVHSPERVSGGAGNSSGVGVGGVGVGVGGGGEGGGESVDLPLLDLSEGIGAGEGGSDVGGGSVGEGGSGNGGGGGSGKAAGGPPKKKRRVALTRVGGVDT